VSLNSHGPQVHYFRRSCCVPYPKSQSLTGQLKITNTQLTNVVSSQSITQKQALQSIIVLTKQICAFALYDGQRRNGLILSSPVLKPSGGCCILSHPELGYRKIQPAEASIGWLTIAFVRRRSVLCNLATNVKRRVFIGSSLLVLIF
jgi:hypothetical protein